jgi:hypothetical protein
MSLGSSFFFSGAFITHWLKRFTFHFYSYLKSRLIGLSIRNGLVVRSEEQARDTDTSYHKAKKFPFYLGLSKNKNELTLLIPYHSNNKKTVKRFTFHFYSYLKSRLIGLSIRNGLVVRSEEQAKKVPKIFPTNEIARSKICSCIYIKV